jgi:hypothetical protein
MHFPFTRGSTKQQAAVVNARMHKVTVNVGLILKHCFLHNTPPVGQDNAPIQ